MPGGFWSGDRMSIAGRRWAVQLNRVLCRLVRRHEACGTGHDHRAADQTAWNPGCSATNVEVLQMRALIPCGVLLLLLCLTPVSADEKPAAAKPAASASVAGGDPLQAARARMRSAAQRLAEAGKADLR